MVFSRLLYRMAWTAGLLITFPAWIVAALLNQWDVRRRIFPHHSAGGRTGSPEGRAVIWWHGASAGEVRALSMLQSEVSEVVSCDSVVSATTAAGLKMWRRAGFSSPIVLPVDTGRAWRRALPQGVRLIVLSETELWPGLLTVAARRGIPVVVASAKLSEHTARALRRTRLLDGLADRLYVGAQTPADAERYRGIGVREERLAVTGSLKWPRGPVGDREDARASLGIPPGRPVIVAGSIRTPEIEMVARALTAVKGRVEGTCAVIAPRDLSDVSFAERLLSQAGWRTRCYQGGTGTEDADAIVVDSMGDLARLYAAADVAVVGGGWEPVGGHNPFEAAVYGVPVVYGPAMAQAGCEMLEASGQAVRVDEDALADAVARGLAQRCRYDSAGWGDPVRATLDAWRRWRILPVERVDEETGIHEADR